MDILVNRGRQWIPTLKGDKPCYTVGVDPGYRNLGISLGRGIGRIEQFNNRNPGKSLLNDKGSPLVSVLGLALIDLFPDDNPDDIKIFSYTSPYCKKLMKQVNGPLDEILDRLLGEMDNPEEEYESEVDDGGYDSQDSSSSIPEEMFVKQTDLMMEELAEGSLRLRLEYGTDYGLDERSASNIDKKLMRALLSKDLRWIFGIPAPGRIEPQIDHLKRKANHSYGRTNHAKNNSVELLPDDDDEKEEAQIWKDICLEKKLKPYEQEERDPKVWHVSLSIQTIIGMIDTFIFGRQREWRYKAGKYGRKNVELIRQTIDLHPRITTEYKLRKQVVTHAMIKTLYATEQYEVIAFLFYVASFGYPLFDMCDAMGIFYERYATEFVKIPHNKNNAQKIRTYIRKISSIYNLKSKLKSKSRVHSISDRDLDFKTTLKVGTVENKKFSKKLLKFYDASDSIVFNSISENADVKPKNKKSKTRVADDDNDNMVIDISEPVIDLTLARTPVIRPFAPKFKLTATPKPNPTVNEAIEMIDDFDKNILNTIDPYLIDKPNPASVPTKLSHPFTKSKEKPPASKEDIGLTLMEEAIKRRRRKLIIVNSDEDDDFDIEEKKNYGDKNADDILLNDLFADDETREKEKWKQKKVSESKKKNKGTINGKGEMSNPRGSLIRRELEAAKNKKRKRGSTPEKEDDLDDDLLLELKSSEKKNTFKPLPKKQKTQETEEVKELSDLLGDTAGFVNYDDFEKSYNNYEWKIDGDGYESTKKGSRGGGNGKSNYGDFGGGGSNNKSKSSSRSGPLSGRSLYSNQYD